MTTSADVLGYGLDRWTPWIAGVVVAVAATVLGPEPAQADDDEGVLRVSVSQIKHDDGKLGCALWSTEAGFPSKQSRAYKRVWGSFSQGRGTCVFRGIPAGVYGVSLMHDENGNGKLDTNLVGMPKEGYGFSNNAKLGTFGPPDFEDVQFSFSGAKSKISVRMQY